MVKAQGLQGIFECRGLGDRGIDASPNCLEVVGVCGLVDDGQRDGADGSCGGKVGDGADVGVGRHDHQLVPFLHGGV